MQCMYVKMYMAVVYTSRNNSKANFRPAQLSYLKVFVLLGCAEISNRSDCIELY